MLVKKRPVLVLAAAVCSVALVSTPAVADSQRHGSVPRAVRVVADGLNGPRQVSAAGGRLYVAESDAGQISQVNPRTGRTRVVVSGLASPQGVVKVGNKFYIADGGAQEPGPGAAQPSLLVAREGRPATEFADLLQHEIDENPDGQLPSADTLSNPYFVIRDRSRNGFLLVADAGGNDILRVDRRGRVSTFAVLPVETTGGCATNPNNTSSGFGCDPVPTGMAYGPDGRLYVSALTSEVAGEGRVYVLNPRTGRIVREITGFTAPTGVAVDRWGNVYVSELFEGLEGPPPTTPEAASAIGQIVKVTPRNRRTYAQVTMPSGLLYRHGQLYASAWSVAGFIGIPDAGQVVTVGKRAFRPLS